MVRAPRQRRCLISKVGLVSSLVLMAGALGPQRPALAAGPQEVVRRTVTGVSAVLEAPELRGAEHAVARRQRVAKIIDEGFRFEEMARAALGSEWERLGAREREEFTALFGQLFKKSYSALVLRFLGERKTTYLGESTQDHRAVVRTALVSTSGERLPVEYRLVFRQGRWVIVDVAVEGLSIAENYRAQFARIIRESSYETLVQRIRDRVARDSS